MILAVPGLVLAMAASALSVDIGRHALEKRRNQSVADLAALDAARDPLTAQAAAEAAAERNGFRLSTPGNTVTAEVGSVDAANTFTPGAGESAVRVSIASQVDYIFAPGSRRVTARAVATIHDPKRAGFAIGSSLAGIDTTKAPLLDAVLGQMMGGSADVVGWQGLLGSHVTLGELHAELVEAGAHTGTPEEFLDAEITLAQLAQATADVLTNKGDSNAALYAGSYGIVAQSKNSATFSLGELMMLDLSSRGAVTAGEINAFQLLTASAIVANGTNTVAVPDAGVSVPGVSNTSLSLQVIEPPVWVAGAQGVTASTAQVRLTVTPTLDLPISVTGLIDPMLSGALPFAIEAAGAQGTLSGITCPDPAGGIVVTVDTKPFSGAASTTLRASDATGPLLDIPTMGTVPETTPSSTDLAFSYADEFWPTAPSKRAGSVPVGLGGLASFTQEGDPTVLGVLTVSILDIVNGAYAALGPLMDDLDTTVVSPLLSTLGVSIGASDVTAVKGEFTGCDVPPYPSLVG
ncbi:MAG: pilus assembly protein TadG-related protein [Acidimicrobiales bacterium]